jgi:hypothetical protein
MSTPVTEGPGPATEADTSPTPDGRPAMAAPTLPDHPAAFRHLDPAAALAFRTPLQEHPPAADTKAAGLLSAFGIMFTVLARYGADLSKHLRAPGLEKWVVLLLLLAFGLLSLGAIVQAFRTITPRFPPAPPSLAFFMDIARMPREEYVRRVAEMSQDEALEQILFYNHTLATICVQKFSHLKKGVRLLRGAFGVWLVVIILINLRDLF